jgi:L,D-transpeptidase YcbB
MVDRIAPLSRCPLVSNRHSRGKAAFLAFLALSLTSCDGASPFGGGGNATVSQSSVSDPQVRAFYQARNWQAAWDGESERELREIIGNALAHGLKPSLFLKDAALPQDRSEREAALTAAALRYASALARGYSDPAKMGVVYTIPRPNPDVTSGLVRALEDGGLKDWFDSLAPQTDEYRALSRAHLDYVQRTAQLGDSRIPAGKPIKSGRRDDRLPAIAGALSAIGYAPAAQESAAPPQRYSGALVDAVKRLQGDLGLKPDGVIGADTLAALNDGPAGRARQVAVAMERLRWLDRQEAPTRIDVNTAAAFLDYWRDGRRVDRRNVVVGEPGWETPQLASPMFQLVAKPMWRVPDSIIEDEISKKSGAWLATNGFEHRNGRLVQRSGPKNALGLVKFDLKNKESIYLHDTPAKALFVQPERHRSHGCVRVQNAIQFADMIASQQGVINEFRKAMAKDEESYVKLKSEIPVRLLYHTVFWDGSRLQFRPDVYGWDENVAVALGFVRGPMRKPLQHKRGEDLGP